MWNKACAISLSIASMVAALPANAEDDTCSIEFAVAVSPAASANHKVAFNAMNEKGFGKSITVNAGEGPKLLHHIMCGDGPYSISATAYSTSLNKFKEVPIGECKLKAGAVILKGSYNSVSVVFPKDFICPMGK